jgi:hypothetical protein
MERSADVRFWLTSRARALACAPPSSPALRRLSAPGAARSPRRFFPTIESQYSRACSICALSNSRAPIAAYKDAAKTAVVKQINLGMSAPPVGSVARSDVGVPRSIKRLFLTALERRFTLLAASADLFGHCLEGIRDRVAFVIPRTLTARSRGYALRLRRRLLARRLPACLTVGLH